MTPAHRDALQRALAGTYRIERELGAGGMSTVYVATDLALDRQNKRYGRRRPAPLPQRRATG